ncbi:ZIP zinc transporter [Amylocarpus encephaloides]|uniref:ZIP zinc transporter n=1 Tax=Amylocarpus encephaloides TaxID=45428 RepID=A0A9P7YI04_9HELO|nr:ZIP zinc transporter [Amylocarpus encephaloides]
MNILKMDNDTRGWIMTLVSGIACMAGASVIYVDKIVQLLPGRQNFDLQENNTFLGSSLSLSFGVMLFSALYGMLPSSKEYFIKGGFTPTKAAWTLIGCFLGGFVCIQIVSRLIHQHISTDEIPCETSGDEESQAQSRRHSHNSGDSDHFHKVLDGSGLATESTALLASEGNANGRLLPPPPSSIMGSDGAASVRRQTTNEQRPSMIKIQKRVMSFVKDTKTNCDSTGPCFGYTDPCGHDCLKHKHSSFKSPEYSRRCTVICHDSGARTASASPSPSQSCERFAQISCSEDGSSDELGTLDAQHHHHVAKNPYMALGLQSTIAIGLHKLPEGFITYATNHANPALGVSVFLSLFVHNISEGFIMALPLSLALQSRNRAFILASVLGAVSQPFGAGIAALWFHIAGKNGGEPSQALYGGMFAITAGIMTSVAIQLFAEGLSRSHNNENLCIAFGFLGMAIMGGSSALTA